jgi:hypothetical protein
LGNSCTSDRDCKFAPSKCIDHVCVFDACLGDSSTVFCNFGQCPDAGAGTEVVECRPECRAGVQNSVCRSCFCPSCAAGDASVD